MLAVNQIYPRLEEEHDLEVFKFGVVSGTVFLRGHKPAEYGDGKSTLGAIQHGKTGRTISCLIGISEIWMVDICIIGEILIRME